MIQKKKIKKYTEDELLLIKKLTTTPHFIINKSLLLYFGYDWEICGLVDYLRQTSYLFTDKWFFNQREKIKYHTGLSFFKQQQIIKKLLKIGILEVKKEGLPAKNYYKFNHNKMAGMVSPEVACSKNNDRLKGNCSVAKKSKNWLQKNRRTRC